MNRSRKNNKRKIKRKCKGGGVSMKTSVNKTKCLNPEISCNFFDDFYPGKMNYTWDTCINMNGIYNHIFYITSQNVLIKSIETLQIPEFMAKVELENRLQKIQCKIKIEDKFVGCFLNICGEWYAIMRLFGKTLNTGYLARTEKNKAFYKLTNLSFGLDVENPNDGDSSITITSKYFDEDNTMYLFKTSSSKMIVLKNCFENITKQNDVFKVLQRFRQEKIFAHSGKENLLNNRIEDALG
jgi:hypothetical protein